MRAYKRLELQLSKSDERSLTRLLRSGEQQVRVVLRSLALLAVVSEATAPGLARRAMERLQEGTKPAGQRTSALTG